MSTYGDGYWGNDGTYITNPGTTAQSQGEISTETPGEQDAPNVLDIVSSEGDAVKQRGLLDIIQKNSGGNWKSNMSNSFMKDMTEEDFESMLTYALKNMMSDEDGYQIPMMKSTVEGLNYKDF